MSNVNFRQALINLVDAAPGIKGVDLVTNFVTSLYKDREKAPNDTASVSFPGGEEVIALINALVDYGELVEVEYVLSDMPYRIKSMYFPKGTKINIVKKD